MIYMFVTVHPRGYVVWVCPACASILQIFPIFLPIFQIWGFSGDPLLVLCVPDSIISTVKGAEGCERKLPSLKVLIVVNHDYKFQFGRV